MPPPHVTDPGGTPVAGPSRRTVLGAALAGLLLPGCSATTRDRLVGVDPRDVRVDRPARRPAPPGPGDAELRRRALVAGSLAAVQAVDALGLRPGDLLAAGLPVDAARQVHEEHVRLLGGPPPTDPLNALAPDHAARVPAPGAGPGALPLLAGQRAAAAVLGAGAAGALRVAAASLAEADLAVLCARVAAARGAQAGALGGPVAGRARWPTDGAAADLAAGVVEALQALLAAEHAAAWSFAVVQAWSGGRVEAAAAERDRREAARDRLAAVVRATGRTPVAPLPTYDTTVDGSPVMGPGPAARLALRLLDDVAARTLDAVVAAVRADAPDVVRAATWRLADVEASRWVWGGPVATLPGR